MARKEFNRGLCVCFFFFSGIACLAQQKEKEDTFFLARKKGIIGMIGRSISTNPPADVPVLVENPFLKYRGRVIRSIQTIPLGFEYNFDDTSLVKDNFGTAIAKTFHKNTSGKVIRNNLFFREGEKLYPFLFADNERYLRDLPYIRDARILVNPVEGTTDSVDVVVLTKDVFSIGAKVFISSKDRGRGELSEDNLFGSGSRLQFSSYYERGRYPTTGVGGEFVRRNIGGSFIDWVSGYQDYRSAFTSNRNQETVVYTRIEKPMVTPYIPTTGALEWSYQRTRNVYDTDSIYHYDYRYASYNIDAWFGYSLDNRKSLYANKEIRIHRFAAIRFFKQHFITEPLKYKNVYDYRFADFTGGLASINIFKQVFYKTNFIYGFGRSEDIPEGFNIALTAGYIDKQSIRRPYAGLDVSVTNVRDKGFYSNYTVRLGGYFYRKRFEDVDLLVSADYFTRLRKLRSAWYHRMFLTMGITAQANPVLNTPLFLRSDFGLTYFNNGNINADLRGTARVEGVFYNTTRVLGFRFAPFLFGDACLVKPTKMNLDKAEFYSAWGGGVRTRNENLVLGTIELRGYFFPRVSGDMNNWKVELNSNIRFRYRSSFIRRPDVIIAN
ncbi:MAG TPA: hypothetical protein PK678_04680 [Ferruginibacter sp.]|jgi:hypothetical protein|nr:hypothetical protein [Ferruginibacter sp.]